MASSSGYNKRVAVVYFSAALLIVSVGVRMVGSLMSESGEGLKLLDWVMIVGIGLEFVVLSMYAAFIWSQPDESAASQTSVVNSTSDPVSKEILEELKKTVEKIQHEETVIVNSTSTETKLLSDISSELQKNQAVLLQTAKELAAVKDNFQKFIDGAVQVQVRAEVEDILNNLINGKVHSKQVER